MQKEDIGDKINELHEVAILYSRSTKKEFKEVDGDAGELHVLWDSLRDSLRPTYLQITRLN